MLVCLPKSLCSRSYRVRGLADGEAEVDFDQLTEQGTVTYGGVAYRIRKHGVTSGRWTLEQDGTVLAEANKPSAWTRTYTIDTLDVTFTVEARSALSSAFLLSRDGASVATIRPMHAFTRRARFEGADALDPLTALFAFWLVALAWQRSDQAAAGSAVTPG